MSPPPELLEVRRLMLERGQDMAVTDALVDRWIRGGHIKPREWQALLEQLGALTGVAMALVKERDELLGALEGVLEQNLYGPNPYRRDTAEEVARSLIGRLRKR